MAAVRNGAVQYGGPRGLGRNPAPLLAALALAPALMIGLRYETGADWSAYLSIFEAYSYMDLGMVFAESDPGYGLLNWVVSGLGLEIWAVNLVCAAIFTWGLVKLAKRQPNPWLAFLVVIPYLVIVVAMGYTRQAVAIGFVMAALAEWDKRSLLRFAIYIVLAATFHKTAVLVLPLVALSATRNRVLTGASILGLGVLLYYTFLESSVDQLLSAYVEAEYSSEGAAIRVSMNLLPAILFLLFQNRFARTEPELKLWRIFSLAALGTLVLLFVLPSSTAVDRVALYLIPLQLVVLPLPPASMMPFIACSIGSASASAVPEGPYPVPAALRKVGRPDSGECFNGLQRGWGLLVLVRANVGARSEGRIGAAQSLPSSRV